MIVLAAGSQGPGIGIIVLGATERLHGMSLTQNIEVFWPQATRAGVRNCLRRERALLSSINLDRYCDPRIWWLHCAGLGPGLAVSGSGADPVRDVNSGFV